MAKKPRSPRYPSLSLPDAIEKVRGIYKKEYTHKIDKKLVAKRMGYNSLNGSSLTAISAVTKYGLLEGRGELQVTPLAVTILAGPADSPERQSAIREAALRPTLFAELDQHYGDHIPTAENVSAYLQKNKFTPHAAVAAVRAFRETFEFVSREGNRYDGPQEEGEGDTEPDTEPDISQMAHAPVSPQPQVGQRRDVFSLAEGEAVLQMPATLSRDSVQEFEDWLELIVKKYRRIHGAVQQEPEL